MRQDARSLLERLEQQALAYYDFTDRVSEIEMWPIFETLLRDPRIVGTRSAAAREVEQVGVSVIAAPASVPPPAEAPASLFRTYEQEVSAPEPVRIRPQEPKLRDFITRIGRSDDA